MGDSSTSSNIKKCIETPGLGKFAFNEAAMVMGLTFFQGIPEPRGSDSFWRFGTHHFHMRLFVDMVDMVDMHHQKIDFPLATDRLAKSNSINPALQPNSIPESSTYVFFQTLCQNPVFSVPRKLFRTYSQIQDLAILGYQW